MFKKVSWQRGIQHYIESIRLRTIKYLEDSAIVYGCKEGTLDSPAAIFMKNRFAFVRSLSLSLFLSLSLSLSLSLLSLLFDLLADFYI